MATATIMIKEKVLHNMIPDPLIKVKDVKEVEVTEKGVMIRLNDDVLVTIDIADKTIKISSNGTTSEIIDLIKKLVPYEINMYKAEEWEEKEGPYCYGQYFVWKITRVPLCKRVITGNKTELVPIGLVEIRELVQAPECE